MNICKTLYLLTLIIKDLMKLTFSFFTLENIWDGSFDSECSNRVVTVLVTEDSYNSKCM